MGMWKTELGKGVSGRVGDDRREGRIRCFFTMEEIYGDLSVMTSLTGLGFPRFEWRGPPTIQCSL